MPKKARELSEPEVRALVAPGLHFVGGVAGVALQICPSGSRSWILRVMIGGRRRDMGLGGYPGVNLSFARAIAQDARIDISRGRDPVLKRSMARAVLRSAPDPGLAGAAVRDAARESLLSDAVKAGYVRRYGANAVREMKRDAKAGMIQGLTQHFIRKARAELGIGV